MARGVRKEPRALVVQNSTKTCGEKPITAFTTKLERCQRFLKCPRMEESTNPMVHTAQILRFPVTIYIFKQLRATSLRLGHCGRSIQFASCNTKSVRAEVIRFCLSPEQHSFQRNGTAAGKRVADPVAGATEMLDQGVHHSCFEFAYEWCKLLQSTLPSIKGPVPDPLRLHVPQGSLDSAFWNIIRSMGVGIHKIESYDTTEYPDN